jgi:hypothetical protein
MMKKMVDVFIPSYHRANNLMTVKTFNRMGYDMSKVTVFIDSWTDDKEDYERVCKEFGCNLEVFDMDEAVRRYDYVHRANKFHRCVGQARNMLQDYAKAKGIDFYFVSDDDTSCYQVRTLGRGNYKRVATLEDWLYMADETEQLMRRRHIGCFAWSQTGDYFDPDQRYIYLKKVMNSTFYLMPYLYRAERGYGDEDTSMFTTMENQGLFTGSYGTGIVLLQVQSAMQAGGLTDMYQECKLLSKAILCPIQYPSAIHAEKQVMNGNRIHHRIKYRYLMPKLLKGDGTVDNIPWDTYPEDMPFTNEPKRRKPIFTDVEHDNAKNPV